MDLLELQPEILKSNGEDSVDNQIDRRSSVELSYNVFYWKYMKANIPVVLTGVSNNWECRRKWTDDNRLNFDYLRTLTNGNVPVTDCRRKYYNSHEKSEMNFHEFLDHWSAKICNESIVTIEENSNVVNPSESNINDNLYYLKDWHLKAQMPEYEFYTVPKHFASDWLNEHLIAKGMDDYRFVYMGPQGSWTPFHADVFGSFSWSTNIIGCKKWLILPPREELKLLHKGRLPFAIEENILTEKSVRYFTLFQAENEAIFVPSGWYHQVTNVTDTISVNHNFFNACNLEKIWNNLATNLQQVIAEIEDCRQMDNFNEHCQTMLRASFGINYLDFLDMLEFIAKRRLKDKEGNGKMSSNFVVFDKYIFNDLHMQYDLQSIKSVLEAMIKDSIVCESQTVLYRRCINLLENVNAGVK